MPDPADDLTCRAIEGWLESSRLHDERAALLEDQMRRLGLVLAELRREGLAERVDALMAKHRMTCHWDVLWALHERCGGG